MAISKEVVHSTEFEGYEIEVVKVEWEAGHVWEFRVSRDGRGIIESEREYGQPAAAARDAYSWIIEEGDAHTFSQDKQPQAVQKIIERGAYRIIETDDYWTITKHVRDEQRIARWTSETITSTNTRFQGDLYLLDVVLKIYEDALSKKPDPYRDLGFTSDFNFGGRGDYQPIERKERRRRD